MSNITNSRLWSELTYIRVNIRELNKVPVTKCLFYIHLVNGLCYTNLVYPKGTYVLYVVDIWDDIIVLKSFIIFSVIYNHVTVTYDSVMQPMTDCDVTLNPNSKSKIKIKIKIKIK